MNSTFTISKWHDVLLKQSSAVVQCRQDDLLQRVTTSCVVLSDGTTNLASHGSLCGVAEPCFYICCHVTTQRTATVTSQLQNDGDAGWRYNNVACDYWCHDLAMTTTLAWGLSSTNSKLIFLAKFWRFSFIWMIIDTCSAKLAIMYNIQFTFNGCRFCQYVLYTYVQSCSVDYCVHTRYECHVF